MTDSDVITAILREARGRVERSWSTGAIARDAHGRPCEPRSPDATSFDAAGAIWASDIGTYLDRTRAIWRFMRANGIAQGELEKWNDRLAMPRSEALRAFDKAIGEQ